MHPLPGSCDVDHRTPGDFVDFTRRLIAGVRTKAALTPLPAKACGTSLRSLTESHCVGHQCWHLHDSVAALTQPRWRSRAIRFARLRGHRHRDRRHLERRGWRHARDRDRQPRHVVRHDAQFLLHDFRPARRRGAHVRATPPQRWPACCRVPDTGWAHPPEASEAPRRLRDRVQQWRDRRSVPALPAEVGDGRCFVVTTAFRRRYPTESRRP